MSYGVNVMAVLLDLGALEICQCFFGIEHDLHQCMRVLLLE